jgi:molybdate transport system substrate-binding protein
MLSKSLRKNLCSLLIVSALIPASIAASQDLTVMSSGGFAAPYKLLAPQFEATTGAHLNSIWGPSMGSTPGAIPARLSRNETADVVIMVRSELDSLAQRGLVVEGSQVDLVRSRIGMAVRAGSKVPAHPSGSEIDRLLRQRERGVHLHRVVSTPWNRKGVSAQKP